MNNHNKHYQQLTQEQRYQISGLRKAGMSARAISQEVGVHFSTVTRELKRNQINGYYHPYQAHRLSNQRRKTVLKANQFSYKTDEFIKASLTLGWSPEAMSQRLKLESRASEQLSHSTIYRRIDRDRAQGGKLYPDLPRFGKNAGKVANEKRKPGLG
jgi:IS30 family transposase